MEIRQVNRSNSIFVILCIVCCLCLTGCSGNTANTNAASGANATSTNAANTNTATANAGEKGAYPQEVADEFVKSCVGAGSNAKFCSCMLGKIQEKYSFEEFSVIESKINAGTPPEDFVEFSGTARAQCSK